MADALLPQPGHSDLNWDRRKGVRVALKHPVEIAGFDQSGRIVTECTTTRNVSEHGCQLECRSQLEPGDLFTLRRRDRSPQCDRPQIFRVVWSRSQQPHLLLGAQRTEGDCIWDLCFPPGSLPEKPQ
jgi:hypothetical protein